MVVGDPPFNHWLLFGTKTDLSDFAARFADGQDQHRVALATFALRTSRFVADCALQQRATEQLGGWKVGGQFVATAYDVPVFHYHK